MPVYGDLSEPENPRPALEGLQQRLRELNASPHPGIERHQAWVRLLIDTGGLAQGLLDAEQTRFGGDGWTALSERLGTLLLQLGGAVMTSWGSGFRERPRVDPAEVAAIAALGLPEEVEVRRPEGYAFYAVYPELYGLAAARLGLPPRVQVIGLRSIGVSLAAAVAAGAQSSVLPVTVRPTGPYRARKVQLTPTLVRRLWRATACAVVDEGPGRSGSSFVGTARTLQRSCGIPSRRIWLFPSHPGPPGPDASPSVRRHYGGALRAHLPFEQVFLSGPHGLATWFEDLIGPAQGPLEDLSGGLWRAHLLPKGRAWPAVHLMQERRKYLLRASTGVWLLRFAGLDRHALHRVGRGRALAAAGFCLPIEAFRHGFTLQRWHPGARPLGPQVPVDRRALLERLGAYLAFRAEHFRAPRTGASLSLLLEMVCLHLGRDGPIARARLAPGLSSLAAEVRPIETDSRLHAWEWLLLERGALVKTDAVDHHCAHDLVGCQDLAWDVAGAEVELGLTSSEARALRTGLELRGHRLSEGLLRLYRVAYPSFHLEGCALAADALARGWPEEAARLRERERGYREAALLALASRRLKR